MPTPSRSNFEFLDNGGLPIAFAHQGGDQAGWNRRNTMAAFWAAHQIGYRYFETDVIRSADGQVVVCHGSSGPKEEATSGLPQRSFLQTLPYAEIRKNHRVGGEEMPLLEEVFDAFPGVRVNIDAETPEVVVPLAKLLRKLGVIDRVCIGSFSYERTKGVAAELGGQDRVCTSLGPLGFIALKSHGLLVPGYIARTQAACFQIPHDHTSSRMIEIAHDHGLDVHVWTPNQATDIERSLDQGVDGVITDATTTLKSILTERQTWQP